MDNQTNTALKQREHDTWAGAAAGWRRRHELLRKGAMPVSERMLELARVTTGSRVLDVASGTGEPALTAARRVGAGGKVVGTDLVEEMLAVAREFAASERLTNVDFQCCDGEALSFADGEFDAVTIRWGLMFMPDPQQCLDAVHKALRPGGRLSVACWAAPDRNPFLAVLLKALANYKELPKPPPGTPGIFAFADPERLRGTLSAAGFRNIELEALAIDVLEVADGHAYWDAISDLAAPVMALVRQLDEPARVAYIDEVIATADALRQGGTLRMQGTTWIAAAER